MFYKKYVENLNLKKIFKLFNDSKKKKKDLVIIIIVLNNLKICSSLSSHSFNYFSQNVL